MYFSHSEKNTENILFIYKPFIFKREPFPSRLTPLAARSGSPCAAPHRAAAHAQRGVAAAAAAPGGVAAGRGPRGGAGREGGGWRRGGAMLRWLVALLSRSCLVSKGGAMFYAVRKGRRTGVYRTW